MRWSGALNTFGYTIRDDVDYRTDLMQGDQRVAIEYLMTRKELGITVTLHARVGAPNVSIDMRTPCLGKETSGG